MFKCPHYLNQGLKRELNQRFHQGQSLIECVLILPLMIALTTLTLTFLYEQVLLRNLQGLLHETLICENSYHPPACLRDCVQGCLRDAEKKAQSFCLFCTVKIRKGFNNEIVARIFFFKSDEPWKALTIHTDIRTYGQISNNPLQLKP